MNRADSHAGFVTTRWSLVKRLGECDGAERRAILESLAGVYWPAVYAYLRCCGRQREQAEELTQGFFTDVVLERDLFEKADASKGQLRQLLKAALKRYAMDQSRRATVNQSAIRRYGDMEAEEERLREIEGTCEDAFDRRWALRQLEEALRRCESHFRSIGKAGHWELFEVRALRPAMSAVAPPPLEESAPRFGFGSAMLGAAALQVVRKRLDALLREIVGETVRGGDVEGEIQTVRRLLGTGASQA